jgi:hypothetical protein
MPTPMHTPLTAAMSGFEPRHRSTQANATPAPFDPAPESVVSGRSAKVSPMSAPAQNARPAPVTTIAPISAFALASLIACVSSRPMRVFHALSLSGRFSVIRRTSPRGSVRMVSGTSRCYGAL